MARITGTKVRAVIVAIKTLKVTALTPGKANAFGVDVPKVCGAFAAFDHAVGGRWGFGESHFTTT